MGWHLQRSKAQRQEYKGILPGKKKTQNTGLSKLSLHLPQPLCQTERAIFTSDGRSIPLSNRIVAGGRGRRVDNDETESSASQPWQDLRIKWEAFHKYRCSGPSDLTGLV